EGALPEEGEVRVEGWVRLSQERPVLGPADPATGRVTVFSRINIPRIGEQVEVALEPVYLVMSGGGEGLPEAVALPAFDNDGPHFGYAIQWFSFAAIGLIGYFFLMRKARPAQPAG